MFWNKKPEYIKLKSLIENLPNIKTYIFGATQRLLKILILI